MGLTDVLCDYIYSSFQKLKKAIEKIEKICKEYIKKLIKVADGIKNVIRLTISDAVSVPNVNKSTATFLAPLNLGTEIDSMSIPPKSKALVVSDVVFISICFTFLLIYLLIHLTIFL